MVSEKPRNDHRHKSKSKFILFCVDFFMLNIVINNFSKKKNKHLIILLASRSQIKYNYLKTNYNQDRYENVSQRSNVTYF